ncbi:MAG: tetratricopeptide repeat protein [Cyanobacteria bacterium J06626_18]
MQEALYQQGIARAKAGNYSAAIAAFTRALQHQFDFADAYYQRGLVHFKRCDFTAAIADYTKALQHGGDDAGRYFARGLAYLSAQQPDAAIADAKQAILLDPASASAYKLIGRARQRQGDDQKAIASYKKAVELYLDQRDIESCRRCLGHIRKLQAQDQPTPQPSSSSSTASESAAGAQTPLTDPDEFLKRAMQKAQRKDYRGAMEDLDWAIQIDPQDAEAYASRSQVRADFGDFHGAIADLQQVAVLSANQSNPEKAQQLQETIQTLQAKAKQAAARTQYYGAGSQTTYPDVEVGRPSPAVQRKLLRLVGDDRKIAVGLVKRLKLKHPGKPDDWYWEKAIYDLGRDRL